jgi:Domain of unknown function (DUF4260)
VAAPRDLPTLFLRTEGAVLLAVAAFLYWWADGGLVVFLVLFLVPDLALLGYLGGRRMGAMVYNMFHTYFGPGILLILGLVIDRGSLVYWALIWFAHIGMDRMFGFGLKHTTGFRDTHLGRIGRDPTVRRSE